MMFKEIGFVAFSFHHLLFGSSITYLTMAQEQEKTRTPVSLPLAAPFVALHSPTLSRNTASVINRVNMIQTVDKTWARKNVVSEEEEVFPLIWDRRELAKKKKKKKKNRRRKKPKFQSTKSPTKSTKSTKASSSPTASPTSSEQALIVSILVSTGISTFEELTTPGTPENAALEWMLDDILLNPTRVLTEAELNQRYIAVAMGYSLTGFDATWLDYTTDECDWTGLICDASGTIVEVSLDNMGLSGSLTNAIGGLTELTSFSVDDNSIGGSIPESTCQMTDMKIFSFSNNQFTGSLPDCWADSWLNIEEIIGGNNNLSGEFDNRLFDMPNIKVIDVIPNDFTNTELFPSQSPSFMPSLSPSESPSTVPFYAVGSQCSLGNINDSLVPNPSFEDHTCCPTNRAELNCASGWVQATEATSDYYLNAPGCDHWDLSDYGTVPQAGSDGGAFVGAIKRNDGGYYEYLGACLTSSLQAGTEYTFTLDIAAADNDGDYFGGDTSGSTELLCVPSCTTGTTFPISGVDYKGGDYTILDTAAPVGGLVGGGEWKSITFVATPTSDCEGVMIGPAIDMTMTGPNGAYVVYDALNVQAGVPGVYNAAGECVPSSES